MSLRHHKSFISIPSVVLQLHESSNQFHIFLHIFFKYFQCKNLIHTLLSFQKPHLLITYIFISSIHIPYIQLFQRPFLTLLGTVIPLLLLVVIYSDFSIVQEHSGGLFSTFWYLSLLPCLITYLQLSPYISNFVIRLISGSFRSITFFSVLYMSPIFTSSCRHDCPTSIISDYISSPSHVYIHCELKILLIFLLSPRSLSQVLHASYKLHTFFSQFLH